MLPHPCSSRSTLILSSHPRSLFLSCFFPPKIQHALLGFPIRVTCPYHLVLLDLTTLIMFGEQYKSQRSSLCSFLHYPVTSSLLGPNIFLSNLHFEHSARYMLFKLCVCVCVCVCELQYRGTYAPETESDHLQHSVTKQSFM